MLTNGLGILVTNLCVDKVPVELIQGLDTGHNRRDLRYSGPLPESPSPSSLSLARASQ